MRPLSEDEMIDIGLIVRTSPIEQAREREIREFWQSGAAAAELPKLSNLTIETEKSHYKRALRRIGKTSRSLLLALSLYLALALRFVFVSLAFLLCCIVTLCVHGILLPVTCLPFRCRLDKRR